MFQYFVLLVNLHLTADVVHKITAQLEVEKDLYAAELMYGMRADVALANDMCYNLLMLLIAKHMSD